MVCEDVSGAFKHLFKSYTYYNVAEEQIKCSNAR